MIISKKTIANGAQAVLTARDLCGNERDAFATWCDDNGLPASADIRRQVFAEANKQWRMSQLRAGVPEKYIRY